MTPTERARDFEHGLVLQALAHSSLAAENARLRSQLREAIAKVVGLESRIKATDVKPVRRPASRADRSIPNTQVPVVRRAS